MVQLVAPGLEVFLRLQRRLTLLATELPAPELPELPELPVSAAVQLPEYTPRSSRKASAAVQLPENTAGAAEQPPKLPLQQRKNGSA
ncbi:unnamed protein product [Boreogadus saida]